MTQSCYTDLRPLWILYRGKLWFYSNDNIVKAATVEGPAQVLKYVLYSKFAENVKYILTSIYGAPKILFHGALPL